MTQRIAIRIYAWDVCAVAKIALTGLLPRKPFHGFGVGSEPVRMARGSVEMGSGLEQLVFALYGIRLRLEIRAATSVSFIGRKD